LSDRDKPDFACRSEANLPEAVKDSVRGARPGPVLAGEGEGFPPSFRETPVSFS
jgi:hypothetical protein